MRPWKVRKDEKAIAARPGIDDSLCIRRGGDGDRRLLLAVLDGRVTAYSKQATGKFKFGHEGLKQRLGAHRRLARCVAMWCDAASREGMLRCAEARRVAYRDVDKSYASHRHANVAGREATSRQRCCRSRHLFRMATKETQLLDRRTTIARLLDNYSERGRTAFNLVRSRL
jgi:hypothetical protein